MGESDPINFSLSQFFSVASENLLTRRFFLGASENDNIGSFPLSYRYMGRFDEGKNLFLGDSQDEIISGITLEATS